MARLAVVGAAEAFAINTRAGDRAGWVQPAGPYTAVRQKTLTARICPGSIYPDRLDMSSSLAYLQ